MKRNSGAGILIWQYLFDPNLQQKRLAVLLLEDKRSKKLMDPGGRESVKHQGSRAITASQELFEESSKLINISSTYIKTQPTVKLRSYKVYSICFDHPEPLNHSLFKHNQSLLKQEDHKKNSDFLETSGFTYVFVQQLLKDGLRHHKHDIKTIDHQGNQVTIKSRTRGALKRILIKGQIDLSSLIMNPVKLKLDYDQQVQTQTQNYATYALDMSESASSDLASS
jgi:hypothetical protein